jgi:Flp pilus assembly pilin Flp
MMRDRRGAGVAEYALLLFLVIAAAGLTFKFLGRRVKHAGDKTEEQFQGGAAGGGGAQAKNDTNTPGAAGPHRAGGATTAGAADTTGGGGTAGGGGGGGAGGAGGNHGGTMAKTHSQGNAPDQQAAENDASGLPVWKIIGGFIVVLFLIAGYFAFRKQKSSG